MNQKKFLVTGGASGLGRAVVGLLAAEGHLVFSADLKPDKSGEKGDVIVPLKMDVTDTKSIARAVAVVSRRTDTLDGIINVAGLFRTGTMVEASEEDYTAIMNVNVGGMFRVNRQFFDLLYRGKGRIVSVSSETARFAAGFNGLYSMTKYAVEAYSDALRRELLIHGMKVIIVQPGPILTPLLASNRETFLKAAARSKYFRPQLEKIARLVTGEEKKAVPPETVARCIVNALHADRPKIRYRVNNDPFRAVLSWLPAGLADRLLLAALC